MKERNKCKLSGNISAYKTLRNKVSALIDIAKKDAYRSKIEDGKSNPRNIWKLFQDFGMDKKERENKSNIKLKSDDKLVKNQIDLTEIFNDYFVNIASKLKESPIQTDFAKLKNYVSAKVPSDTEFKISLTTHTFVKKFLSSLNVNKSTGLDNIGPKILKLSADVITPSILYIVNKSISISQFPDLWKEAKVKPLFKSGSKDDINNYRPISILPTVSKLIEKWVEKQFSQYLNEFNLLHKSQSGFRSRHSTESALILMVDSWLKAINEGKIVGCVLVDFRKAFDLVDHEILLRKLKCYKCNDSCLSWFESYLCHRKQRVSLNNNLSSTSEVIHGVPQGSILGPLLFLIFINDLPLYLENKTSTIDLYADDTTIYYSSSDTLMLERNLQKSLDCLQIWCRENGMILNTDKTKVMLITSRQKRMNLNNAVLNLQYNDIDITITTCDKILGIHVDNNLTWNNHFNFLSKKLSSHLWLLSKVRIYLSIEHRVLFYNAYIKPHIDYCSSIWSNTSSSNISKITRLQRRACKLILRHEYNGLSEAFEKLKILSIDQSIFLSKAKTMYKIHNNLAPSYLNEMFLMRNANLDNTTSNLRSVTNKNFVVPLAKCNLFKGSLTYSGVIIWNSIPVSIKNSSSLPMFVHKCTEWLLH